MSRALDDIFMLSKLLHLVLHHSPLSYKFVIVLTTTFANIDEMFLAVDFSELKKGN